MKTKNKTPLRQCTGCREMKSKKEMIRVLRTPENEIVLDATGRKNGRGAYVCLSQECLEKAVKTTCFLADMADFAAFNEVYGRYFTTRPARSCVAVKALPKGVLAEIEVVAEL